MRGTRMGTMPRKKKMSGEEPKNAVVPTGGEFLFYQAEDGQTRLQVRLEGETVWLTQKAMAELFQKDVRTINGHIQNIFSERELQPDSVIRNFRITAADGKNYNVAHYNLDVIISVGYRVKSHRGTQFRIWATQRLREYIMKDPSKNNLSKFQISNAIILYTVTRSPSCWNPKEQDDGQERN